jgi:Fe2+ or Zn2+ uptake regulation protein
MANSHSATEEILYFLWNPKAHYHIHCSSCAVLKNISSKILVQVTAGTEQIITVNATSCPP